MKVELLKNIANCCAKPSEFEDLAYPVLDQGCVWATNKVVAVRYTEFDWRAKPSPSVPWQIRDEDYSGLKPRDEICFDADGFYATTVHGDPISGHASMGRAAASWPGMAENWGRFMPEGGDTARLDMKQLRKVIGVFQQAGICPEVHTTASGMWLRGGRHFAGFQPYVEAIVMGMRI